MIHIITLPIPIPQLTMQTNVTLSKNDIGLVASASKSTYSFMAFTDSGIWKQDKSTHQTTINNKQTSQPRQLIDIMTEEHITIETDRKLGNVKVINCVSRDFKNSCSSIKLSDKTILDGVKTVTRLGGEKITTTRTFVKTEFGGNDTTINTFHLTQEDKS